MGHHPLARGVLPTRTLAQAIVRVADSFMYAHYLGGNRPEIEQAVEVIELMPRPCGSAGPERPGISGAS